MKKRHIHADLIHAWAEGAEIQRRINGTHWFDVKDPDFTGTDFTEYRVKPRTVKREGWVNIYRYLFTSGKVTNSAGDIFNTKAEAVAIARAGCIDTVQIEWEEEE